MPVGKDEGGHSVVRELVRDGGGRRKSGEQSHTRGACKSNKLKREKKKTAADQTGAAADADADAVFVHSAHDARGHAGVRERAKEEQEEGE